MGWAVAALVGLVLVALILPALGRSGSFPMRRTTYAMMQLQTADQMIKAGDDTGAREILNEIIADFSDTPSAPVARDRLERIDRPAQ